MSHTAPTERRRQRRHTVDTDVLLIVEGEPVRRVRVANANTYGCCLRLGEEGLPAWFHLVDTAEGNVVRAEVRWWRDDLAGLVFTQGWWLSKDAPGWIREALIAYGEVAASQAA